MIILRVITFSILFVAAAHSEGLGIMEHYFLSGEKLELKSAEIRKGIPLSQVTAKSALVAYRLGDDIQVVVGASQIEITTTPWGPTLVGRGAVYIRVTHKGMVTLSVSLEDADNPTVITIGSDASQKTGGKFMKYEYELGKPPAIDLPEKLKPLIERIPEFLTSAPEYALLALQKKNAEQNGADQPATAPESKLEGKEKLKSESEGRSR